MWRRVAVSKGTFFEFEAAVVVEVVGAGGVAGRGAGRARGFEAEEESFDEEDDDEGGWGACAGADRPALALRCCWPCRASMTERATASESLRGRVGEGAGGCWWGG